MRDAYALIIDINSNKNSTSWPTIKNIVTTQRTDAVLTVFKIF